jgi:beta-galactosidase
MTTQFDFFPMGSSYYPPFHVESDWERDIRRMAEGGLNTIRTGELIATWEWIEPRRGRFDFSWLDRLFELAERYHLKVLLGTGAASPPVWMLEDYPDLQIVSRDGVRYPIGAMWGWACLDHPGFCDESERYLRTLLQRYKDHAALLGWQIHNEIGYPIIPRKSSGLPLYCYCGHTARKFREWLQAHYSTIDALNEAWPSTPTRHRYYDWHQIDPPRSLPSEWAPTKAWLDWRSFIYDDIAEFVAWQDSIIRSEDKRHPTTANLIDTLTHDFSVLHGADPWRIAKVPDAIGWDMYPGEHPKSGPTFCSMFLDNAFSTAMHNGVPLWLTEVESGPIGGWSLGPDYPTNGLDIKRYGLEALAHGAKMILYQGYREWNALPLHWGALVDLHGDPTERYDAAREINRVVDANQGLFVEAMPAGAEVAILYSQDNVTTAYGMDALDHFRSALEGVYQTLWALKMPVEFVTPELLAAGKGHTYRALFAPFLMNISSDLAQAIRSFVSRGGTFVAFGKFGMLDSRGWYWDDRPGAGLTDLFGVREKRIRVLDDVALFPEASQPVFEGINTPLKGYWHQQDLTVLGPNVEILAHFADGEVAAVRNRFGEGTSYYFGTHLDAAVRQFGGRDYRRLFGNLLNAHEIRPPILLESPDKDYVAQFVDVHRSRRGNERLVIVLNHGKTPQDLRVVCREETALRQARNLFTGQSLTLQRDSENVVFDLRLEAFDGAAIRLS